jgi:hypothetical protein
MHIPFMQIDASGQLKLLEHLMFVEVIAIQK